MTDYGEFKYGKRAADAIPQIRLRPSFSDVGVRFKVKRAIELLQSNEKVEIIVRTASRKKEHVDGTKEVMESILSEIVPEHARLLAQPKFYGRKFSCTVVACLPPAPTTH